MAAEARKRPKVSPELLKTLHEGKAKLHRERERLDLREKVRILLELQRICLPLIERRRALAEWERPWSVTP